MTNGKIWLQDHKFWSPTYLITHIRLYMYVTLHTRKVTYEEPKLLKAAQVRPINCNKATTACKSLVRKLIGLLPSYFK